MEIVSYANSAEISAQGYPIVLPGSLNGKKDHLVKKSAFFFLNTVKPV